MKRVFIPILALILSFCFASAAMGEDVFQLGDELGVGARALAMGGAFVAIADDGTAAYWNPAGITQIKVVGITPGLTAMGDWTNLQFDPGDQWPPDFGNTTLGFGGMLGVNFSGFGVSLLVVGDGWTSYVDTGGTDSSEGNIKAYGVGMVTLATKFTDLFAVGANIKYIYGQSFSFNASGDPFLPPTYTGYYTEGTGTGYAVDIGAMFKVGTVLRIGLAVKNYGTVEWTCQDYTPNISGGFDAGSPYPLTEDYAGVAQLGVAAQIPVIGTLIAVQADKPLDGDTMTYRIGIEQSLLVVKLRAGGIMAEGFDPMYTVGVGLKLGPVVLDVAALTDDAFAIQAAMLTAGFTF